MRHLLAACLAATAVSFAPALAIGQEYPERPITMVVPFSAGGPTDTVTRLIAEPMKKSLGQDIVVQNVTGAGGTVAAGQVANAEADGYTVLIHHIGMSTAPTLYANLPYDPLADFEMVGLVTEVPMTIVARKDLEPMIGTRTRVAEVLNRKRGLSINMIRRLHERLGISADVLIRPSRRDGSRQRP